MRLTDTVDRGVGDVDLLKDVTVAVLEAQRTAHGGCLVFGVDISEAANGTEKASGQGVAIHDAWVDARFAGGRLRAHGRHGGFSTETQAIVAIAGQTTRDTYYTPLGESCSSRITAGNAIPSAFDSTLKIAVPESLAGATTLVVRVRLVDTNTTRATRKRATTTQPASRTWRCSRRPTRRTSTQCCRARPPSAARRPRLPTAPRHRQACRGSPCRWAAASTWRPTRT